MLYGFRRTRQPQPGSMSLAFLARFFDPIFHAKGNGVHVNNPLRPMPLQSPQVYVTKTAPVSGVGGLVAGQIVGQPLIDPNSGG